MRTAKTNSRSLYLQAISDAIETEMATSHKSELFYSGTHADRQTVKKTTLDLLLKAIEDSPPQSFVDFRSMVTLDSKNTSVKENLKHKILRDIITNICQTIFPKISELLESANAEVEENKARFKTERSSNSELFSNAPKIDTAFKKINQDNLTHLHGGSGYTGRLRTGTSAAPVGTESFRSDDEPREGLKHWVNKQVIAGGAGAGYSLGELSGSQAVAHNYDAPCKIDDLRLIRREKLLDILDNATNPSTFLCAFLAYYYRSSYIAIGNIGTISAANINNPSNRWSLFHLDTIYRHICENDEGKILTPERSARFLILCSSVLEKATTKEFRNHSRQKINDDDINLTLREIKDYIKDVAKIANIDPDQLESDIKKLKISRRNINPSSLLFSRDL